MTAGIITHPIALPWPPALKGWSQIITQSCLPHLAFFLSQGDKSKTNKNYNHPKNYSNKQTKKKPFRQLVSASTVTFTLDALGSGKDCWLTFSMMGQEKGNTKLPKFCRNKELCNQVKGNREQAYSRPRRQNPTAPGLNRPGSTS